MAAQTGAHLPEWVREYVLRMVQETAAVTSDRLTEHLGLLIARVVRTGHGPRSLVGWVSAERQKLSSWDRAALTAELTARLVQWFLPAGDPLKRTVRETAAVNSRRTAGRPAVPGATVPTRPTLG